MCTHVHTCLHVYVHICVRECKWRSKVDVSNCPPSLVHRDHWNRFSQSHPEWLVSLASLLWRAHLFLLSPEVQEGCHPHLALTWILGTWTWFFTFSWQGLLTTEPSPQLQNLSSNMQRHVATCTQTHTGNLYWVAVPQIFNTERCGRRVPAGLPQSWPSLCPNHFLPNSRQFVSHSEVASQLSIG